MIGKTNAIKSGGVTKVEETLVKELNMATGNQEITPDVEGEVIAKVTVQKPATMLPENIKKNVNIGGVTGTYEGSGGSGEKPTLFAPTTTQGLNSVTWSTNTNNGKFAVTTVGRIDQTEVTSPLTITSEMNGKTLYITSSAENFNSSDKVLTLAFTNIGGACLVNTTANTYRDTHSSYTTNFSLFPVGLINVAGAIDYYYDGTKLENNSTQIANYVNNNNFALGQSKSINISMVILDNSQTLSSYTSLLSVKDYNPDNITYLGDYNAQSKNSTTIEYYLNGAKLGSTVNTRGTSTFTIKGVEFRVIFPIANIQVSGDNYSLSQFNNNDVITFVISMD